MKKKNLISAYNRKKSLLSISILWLYGPHVQLKVVGLNLDLNRSYLISVVRIISHTVNPDKLNQLTLNVGTVLRQLVRVYSALTLSSFG